ncbi:MAG: hypothetical protein K6B69_12675 [Lachnospiraceae bacterium]|nr:hypothetical protein [Lachnospiraceae bacterium]
MTFTILFSMMMMLGLFLMLWGGVGFIQDKKFFSSAPVEVQNAVPDSKPERFKGQHTIGWVMIVLSFVFMIGALVLGAWDGIRNGFDFQQLFVRFIIMLLGLKAFDIGFFDWVLLCNAGFNFFPHYYPETKPVLGHYLFGYNWKTHATHILAGFPLMAIISGICLLIK